MLDQSNTFTFSLSNRNTLDYFKYEILYNNSPVTGGEIEVNSSVTSQTGGEIDHSVKNMHTTLTQTKQRQSVISSLALLIVTVPLYKQLACIANL